MAQSPKYDLAEVKRLVEDRINGGDGVWFRARKSSISYVIHVLKCDETGATDHILKGLLRLQSGDFARTTLMVNWDNEVADEYGLQNYLGHNWYIKFFIEDEDGNRVLQEVSFHPTEEALRLGDGRVLKPTIDDSKIPPWREKKPRQ